MPISQDRIKALVEAAKDYRQAMEQVMQCITDAKESAERGSDPMLMLMRLWELNTNPHIMLKKPETAGTLAKEEIWIRTFYKINEGRRRSQRRYRARKELQEEGYIPKRRQQHTGEDEAEARARLDEFTRAANEADEAASAGLRGSREARQEPEAEVAMCVACPHPMYLHGEHGCPCGCQERKI